MFLNLLLLPFWAQQELTQYLFKMEIKAKKQSRVFLWDKEKQKYMPTEVTLKAGETATINNNTFFILQPITL